MKTLTLHLQPLQHSSLWPMQTLRHDLGLGIVNVTQS